MKSKSWIIKGFVFIFVAFLIFPNAGLFRGEKNVAMIAKENRKITAFPKSSTKEKVFYTNFEKWYQDRLRYRDKMIKRWKKLNMSIGVMTNDKIFRGKNNWYFNKNRYIFMFQDASVKANKIKKLQEFCNSRGVDFVYIVPAAKEAIYLDWFPKDEQLKQDDYRVWEKKLEDCMRNHKINYLSLTNALFTERQHTSNPLYFYDDHHWSYYGSLVGTNLLLSKLYQMGYSNIDTDLGIDGTKKEAFKESSYARDLGIDLDSRTLAPWSKYFSNEIYVTDSKKNKTIKISGVLSNDVLWDKIVNGEAVIENRSISGNITLLMLGDSYSSYMMPYLSQKVSKIVVTHFRDCVGEKKMVDVARLINKYNPDVVVLETAAPSFFHSKGDTNFKNMVF